MNTFSFSRHGLSPKEHALERAFEILPGLTSWTILIGMTILSFTKPGIAALVIISFNLFWFLRIIYMTIFLILSYGRLSMEKKTDWLARIRNIEALSLQREEILDTNLRPNFKEQISFWIHRQQLKQSLEGKQTFPLSKDIFHLVIFPLVKESRQIIEPSVEGIVRQKFPLKQILIILAVEERALEAVKRDAYAVQERYKEHFLDFLIIIHPDGLPGEAKVKGANVTYAAKEAKNFFESRNIAFENIVVSCFDADTVVSPDYFSCLTYHFMICPQRTRVSFQPIPVYHNNIWQAPGFARVLEMGSSFFQLIESTHFGKIVTFSSHSMSFKALVDVGYWPVDMISDDSAIFWKSFIYFEGQYWVIPMYVTLSMDVVMAETWWKTIKNVYKQKRRWAWGVENFPIVMRAFLKSPRISFNQRFSYVFKLFEGHVSWATWAFLLTFVGWIPAFFAGRAFSETVLYYSAPRVTATIFHLSFISLLTTMLLSWALLPPDKNKHSFFKKIIFTLEWLLVPVIAVFLSALPALDAQTRLMFGRYMEFWVTDKKRQ